MYMYVDMYRGAVVCDWVIFFFMIIYIMSIMAVRILKK